MSDLEILEKIRSEAVMRLRVKKLAAGKPFMINSNKLPRKQNYLEFPDRSIKLVTVAHDSHSFIILKELSRSHAQAVRQRYNLI